MPGFLTLLMTAKGFQGWERVWGEGCGDEGGSWGRVALAQWANRAEKGGQASPLRTNGSCGCGVLRGVRGVVGVRGLQRVFVGVR
jgi:hypothetical protein